MEEKLFQSKEVVLAWNTCSTWGQKYLLSPREVMAVDVLQSEEISGEEKNGDRKGVGSAICRRRANGGSINIEKR